MEDNSSIPCELEANTLASTETVKISIATADPSKDDGSKVTQESNNQNLSMPDENSVWASTIKEDNLLADFDNNSSESKSTFPTVSETQIELDSLNTAMEAKLLNEGDDERPGEDASSSVVQLSENKIDLSGDADMEERLWYESDDDTMETQNISSAIALLAADMIDVDSVDAATEEKLLSDSENITVEHKNTLTVVDSMVENKIEHGSTATEGKQLDTLDDNAMEIELTETNVTQLTENKSENDFVEKNISEKPSTSETQSANIIEEKLLDTKANNLNQQIYSAKTLDAEQNFPNDGTSLKSHNSDITKENLLDAELTSENQRISASDEIMEEIDEEELLKDTEVNTISKPEKVDIIGQNIKAVLETGKSSLCKNVQIVESSPNSKEEDNANTISKDTSSTIETVEDSTSKSETIISNDKIDDQHDSTPKTVTKNIEIAQNTDKAKSKSDLSISDTEKMDITSGDYKILQKNTTEVRTENIPEILEQKKTVVTADSITDIHNSASIGTDNSESIPENILDSDQTIVTADSHTNIDSSLSVGTDNICIKTDDNINTGNIHPENILDVDINKKQTNIEIVNTNEAVQIATKNENNKADNQDSSDTKADSFAEIDSSADTSTDVFIHKKSSHNLHMPDVMLEIPTQELIDIDDVLDSPNESRTDDFPNETDDINKHDEKNEKTLSDVGNENNKESNCKNISENKTKMGNKDIAGFVIEEAQPSTSSAFEFTPDTFDAMPEMTDSLGLLAESQRVQDDDDDDDNDGAHEDDDFEQDESSNQMTGEHSEDSNAQQSETDIIKYEEDKETREEVDDKVSNESEGDSDDFIEEAPNDAVEIEEHSVTNLDGDVGAEKVDSEENNTGAVLGGVEDTQVSEYQPKGPDIKIEKSDLITVNNDNDDKISTEVVQKIEVDDAITLIENTDKDDNNVKVLKADSVKGKGSTEDDVEEVKASTEVEKEKDNALKENLEKEVCTTKEGSTKATAAIESNRESEKNKEQDEDVVDQTPEIPTYNLSDSDNDDDVTATTVQNNKRKTTDNISTATDKGSKKTETSSKLNEHVVSIVELQETSSEEDVLEADKDESLLQKSSDKSSSDVTTINLPTDIVVTSSSSGNTSEILTTQEKVVISRVRTPISQKTVTRLNTSEVTIKTATSADQQTLVIPEKQMQTGQADGPTKPKETPIYSLDSDEEDATEPSKLKKKRRKCINSSCTSGATVFRTADNDIVLYYDASRKRKPLVCQPCVDAVITRKQSLIDGIKAMVPLAQLDMGIASLYPVEILDSDSEDEEPQLQEKPAKESIGEDAAKFLEENLAEMLNSTWKKYNLDDRLKETQAEINAEIEKFELESKEINDMLNECQKMTDKLRTNLYATFQPRIQSEPPLLVYETPEFRYIGPEAGSPAPPAVPKNRLVNKRKMLTNSTPPAPAKRPSVIPLGYTPLNDPILKVQETKIVANSSDDDKDVSVVKLSAESPPPDLPPPGELTRAPLRVDMPVYAMKNAFGPWLKGVITEIMPKGTGSANFTSCRVQFDHITKNNNSKILPARCIAYAEPPNVRMTIGTRLIALFKDANKDSNKRDSFSSGVVAEAPTPVNNFRYLVFFDDGYAQYVKHPFTRLVCECSSLVWEEVHPFSRDFVKEYLMAFPERPMVRLHQGQNFKTEWNGKWWASRVLQVDASLVQVLFVVSGRKEWIYRGSTRLAPLYMELQAAERHRSRALGTRRQPPRNNMPYVEYTRSEEQQGSNKVLENLPPATVMTLQEQKEELRKQRAVAKKSTTIPTSQSGIQQPGAKPATDIPDNLTSRVVYYTPKNAVRPYKLVPHQCSPQCKRSVLSLEDLRTYNPLAKPLLSGWERQTVRFKGQKEVMYRAPCGRRLRNMKELHRYLQMTESELSVDLFDFFYGTHCLAEFQIYKCLTGKKDLSQGRENVPIPCVNYYDHTLPEFCSYNTERTPTSGVPLNLDPEFLCGCDCTDDCEDKTKCACWKMTLEGARTIGLDSPNIGYEYKRLPEPLPSGIYECNSRCKCKNTCLNRVAQHPLQLKLQVFKTLNRGWGIRALNDVPKGAFLCVYAGNLLTDATANLDGLNEGDEYLAELDYIEVVEQMKEGYEADIPEEDKKLDAEQSENADQEDSQDQSSSSSEEEQTSSRYDKEDDDFKPAQHVGPEVSKFSKHLRKRSREEEKADKEKDSKDKDKNDENYITISDDEEAREPSRFAAQTGMDGNELISKHRSVRSYFGEDEACYIMDAKVQGNIGRYLNHSCSPNVFVQNVFVDTHDPRFPWVAFFALSHIKAGTELTWNYNYDVGSVPNKVLYCYCQAPNCRGRLL